MPDRNVLHKIWYIAAAQVSYRESSCRVILNFRRWIWQGCIYMKKGSCCTVPEVTRHKCVPLPRRSSPRPRAKDHCGLLIGASMARRWHLEIRQAAGRNTGSTRRRLSLQCCSQRASSDGMLCGRAIVECAYEMAAQQWGVLFPPKGGGAFLFHVLFFNNKDVNNLIKNTNQRN